jgi:hypothetical protein
MGSFGTSLHRDCNSIGDLANISPRIPSTCASHGILTLLIIHIFPCYQMYMAIDNPLLVSSVSCLTTNSYLCNSIRGADNISHTETAKATAADAFLTCTNFEIGSKLPKFSGIAVSAMLNQYSTTAQSSLWRLIFNHCCSCHRRRPFSVP